MINHRSEENQTNAKHNDDMRSPEPNTLHITIDFKQSVVIGRQKTERNALYNVREALGFSVSICHATGRFHLNQRIIPRSLHSP